MIDGNGNETRTIYEAHLLEENIKLKSENKALKAEKVALVEALIKTDSLLFGRAHNKIAIREMVIKPLLKQAKTND